MQKHLFALLLLFAAGAARATTIEGVAPDGTIVQVGVTNSGFLLVNQTGSSTTLSSVQIAGPLPLPVAIYPSSNTVTVGNTGADPVPVNVVAGNLSLGTVTTVASTTTANVTAQGSQSGAGAGFSVMPANTARNQSTIINSCGLPGSTCGAILWVGNSGVAVGTGYPIPPGGTYSPDVPSSFTGQMYGASTATVTWAWISH